MGRDRESCTAPLHYAIHSQFMNSSGEQLHNFTAKYSSGKALDPVSFST